MAKDFYIPKLGQTVEEVTIVKWLVEDGAKVEFGDELVEVETDKAVFPVEANAKGHVHIGPYKAGDVVPILTVVATIGKKDETFEPGTVEEGAEKEAPETPEEKVIDKPEEGDKPVEEAAEGRIFASPRARRAAARLEVDLRLVTPTGGNGQRVVEQDVLDYAESMPRVTPVAQKIAAEKGVDLRQISGSGDQGKIIKADVLRAAEEAPPQPEKEAPTKPEKEAAPQPEKEAPPETAPVSDEAVIERIPLKGVRGVIARRMAESVQQTARVTLTAEVDATDLVALRERLKAKYSEAWGFSPGYNDLLALIVTAGLRQFPYMNARLSEDGEAIERLKPINLGMAVDTERGLMVPVIKDADQMGLRQFGQSFRELVQRTRSGKSSLDDLSGGTFTITSLGIYRVEAFTPVINLPEAAILGVGRIKEKPAVKDGEIAIRQMVVLSLVFDHRLTDGAPAARFLDYICEVIEEPSLLFLTRR